MIRVHYGRGDVRDKKEKGTYSHSDLNGILYGTVNKVFEEHGFLKPYKYLPCPYNTEKDVYFDMPEESAEIKQGQQVVFILRQENFQNPNVVDIEFPGVTYDRQFCPYIDPECGHIVFEDEYENDEGSICNKSCMRTLSCGHRCLKKCSEKCLKKCKPCFQEWKKRGEAPNDSSNSDDILFGTVIGIHEDYGFIKPDLPLPHPFNKRKDVYFDKLQNDPTIRKGQKVVFILNKGCHAKPNVCELAFVDGTYDPQLTSPYRREQCGHICFRNRNKKSPKCDDCFEHCTKTLSCGHPCQRKCSEECLKMCSRCFEEEKYKTYKLSDLNDLLYGTVTNVTKSYGFLKADCQLPKDYNRSRDIYFPIDKDDGLSISKGQRVIFVLNKESYDRPSVSDKVFVGESYPDSAHPYKHKRCGHICFLDDRDCNKNGMGKCLKECSKLLPCGHQCPEICSDTCPPMCYDCVSAHPYKHKRRSHSCFEDVRDREENGMGKYLKKCSKLLPCGHQCPEICSDTCPPMCYDCVSAHPYKHKRRGHSCFEDVRDREENGMGKYLKKCSKSLPCGHQCPETCSDCPPMCYDCVSAHPYKHKRRGHICFQDDRDCEKYGMGKCLKKCSKLLPCGHQCPEICSDTCPTMCYDCIEERGKQAYAVSDLEDLLYGTVVKIKEGYGFLKPNRQLPKPYCNEKDIHFTADINTIEKLGMRQNVVFLLKNKSYDKPCATDVAFPGLSYDTDIVSPYRSEDCSHICFKDTNNGNSEKCMKDCMQNLSCGHRCRKKCSEKCYERCDACHRRYKEERRTYTLPELDDLLFGTVVDLNGRNVFIKPDRQLPPPYNSRKDIAFFDNDSSVPVSKGKQVVFSLAKEKKDKPGASQILVLDEYFDSSTMEPYIRPECSHICLLDRRMQNNFCFNKCSRKMACGHSCLEICSFPCPESCGKCSNIRERAFVHFKYCSDINVICIGAVSFVGEEHGYIKPFLPDQDTTNKKTGIYFTFRGSQQCDIKKKMWGAYTMNKRNVEHPTVSELAVVENENADYTHMSVYYVKQLPRQGPKRDGQNSSDNQVEKLEIEAQEDYSNKIRSWKLRPNRHLVPTDPLDLNFQIAESRFLRSAAKSGKQYQIESIDYYVKPDLVRKFRAKKSYFESCYGKGDDSKYVFAFHGTDRDNIDSIVRDNFQLEYCKRSMYGKGIYLSEFVDVTLPFGRSLLLCKVLPGKSLDVSNSAWDSAIVPNFNSHRVKADAEGYGWALVIDDPDQILPCYVINYKEVVDSRQNTTHVLPSAPPIRASAQHQASSSYQNTNQLPLQLTQQSKPTPQVYGSSLATVSSASTSGTGSSRSKLTAVSPMPSCRIGSSGSKLTAVSTTATSGTGISRSKLAAVSTTATATPVTGSSHSKYSANTHPQSLYPNPNVQSLQPQTKQVQPTSKGAPPRPPPPLTVSRWGSNDTSNQGSQLSQSISNTRQSSSVVTYPNRPSRGQASGSLAVPLAEEVKEGDLTHRSRKSSKKNCIIM